MLKKENNFQEYEGTLACPTVDGSHYVAEARGFPNGGGGAWASKSGLWYAGGSFCDSAPQ